MATTPAVDVLATATLSQLTREIFGNIPRASQLVFYVGAAIACAIFAYGVWRRVRVWRQGVPDTTPRQRWPAVVRFFRDALGQRRVRGRGLASVSHALLYFGFVTLFIGTVLIAIEHLLASWTGQPADQPVFHRGVYYAVYELVMDLAGVALLIGCGLFAWRRWRPGGSFARSKSDWIVLGWLLAVGISGFLVEGLRILHDQTTLAAVSPVGAAVATVFHSTGTSSDGASWMHFVVWWGHAVGALTLIAFFPYTRLMHAVAGGIHLLSRQEQPLGFMHPVDLDEADETGKVGVAVLTDFTRQQLLELDACVSCGRCQDACPAFEAGKPLSPRQVVQDMATCDEFHNGTAGTVLPGQVIKEETLWSCTTCGACTDVCPLGISPLRMITDLRRHLIGEGGLRGAPAKALQKTERLGNPWGMSPTDRLDWANGLEVPLVKDRPDFELLYWVGCAAAYDRRLQKIVRATIQLLNQAGVRYAVLGPEERCTGEAARRMGDEFLFQHLAEENIATLGRHQVKKLVSHCPHCVNSFRHDYPQLGGKYEVLHHSQLLDELLKSGALAMDESRTGAAEQRVTFHDPCYLARGQNEVDAPRSVLSAAGGGSALPLVELGRNRSATACCGGGGGRMWFDDPPAERTGQGRVQEIAEAAADTVAVACPFCHIMLADGLAAERPDVRVRDVAEILAERCCPSQANGEAD